MLNLTTLNWRWEMEECLKSAKAVPWPLQAQQDGIIVEKKISQEKKPSARKYFWIVQKILPSDGTECSKDM
jgi:hypothetical protein